MFIRSVVRQGIKCEDQGKGLQDSGERPALAYGADIEDGTGK